MPMTFDARPGFGAFVTVGQVDFEAGFAVLDAGLAAIRDGGGPSSVLFDLRQSSENRSADELRVIASAIAGRLEGARLAVLVSRNLTFGISRMFAVFAGFEGLTAAVFRDRAEALAFLGVPAH